MWAHISFTLIYVNPQYLNILSFLKSPIWLFYQKYMVIFDTKIQVIPLHRGVAIASSRSQESLLIGDHFHILWGVSILIQEFQSQLSYSTAGSGLSFTTTELILAPLRPALTFLFAQDYFAQFPTLVLPNDIIYVYVYTYVWMLGGIPLTLMKAVR